jgi:hypothetical protein
MLSQSYQQIKENYWSSIGKLPIGNLPILDLKVNTRTTTCVDNIVQDNLSVNDLLENINILLKYIKKAQILKQKKPMFKC